eukprot:m51a1_g11997 putative protein serine threonine (740) ;mRNA; f:1687-5034
MAPDFPCPSWVAHCMKCDVPTECGLCEEGYEGPNCTAICKNPNCRTCSTPTSCTSCVKGSVSNGCEPDGPMCAERPDNASCTALGCGWCNTTLLCMLRHTLPTYCPTCESSGLEGPQCSRSPACKWCALEEKCKSAGVACVSDCEGLSADTACERVPGQTCGNTACRNCSAARFRSRCGTGDLVGCASAEASECKDSCRWCNSRGQCIHRSDQCPVCPTMTNSAPRCSCASAEASECKDSCRWCNSRGQCIHRSDQCPVCPTMTNSVSPTSYDGCTYDGGMGTCKDRSDSFTCGIVAIPELSGGVAALVVCLAAVVAIRRRCMNTEDSGPGDVEFLSAVSVAALVPGMVAVLPSDSCGHIWICVSRHVIDFNGAQIAVDRESSDTLTVTNVSRKTVVVRFVAEGFASTGPTGEGERCRVAVNEKVRVEMEPGAEYDLAVSVTPAACGLACGVVAVVPEGGREYVAVPVRAATGPSARIEWSDIALGERIGEGGFGVVHRARWRGLDVAVKEMHGWLGQIDVLAEEMRREVDIMMALRSPHVVAFYGYVLSDAHRALVMELSPLGSLSSLLTKPIEPSFKAKALLDCAEGMRLLHAHGILHRDLKPDNLLVFSMCVHDSVCVKLSDFGTSRAIGDDMARAYTKGVGTLLYMAPEIINGKPYNAKADVWSFAVLYYHVWTQEEPYSDLKNQGAIMSFVTSGHRLPIPVALPHGDLLSLCWAGDPARRPSFEKIVATLTHSS